MLGQRWVGLVVLVVLALVLTSGALWLSARDNLTQANCDRVQTGMSLGKVILVLGRNPDYDHKYGENQRQHVWEGTSATFSVVVDSAGMVSARHFQSGGRGTLLERLWKRFAG
jgi:hypothetical protein